jgi:putative ATPase
MEYLPEKISGTRLFEPQDTPKENSLRELLRKLWKKYGY